MNLLARIALPLALLVLLQGCDSFVADTEPSTSISQEVALTNPDAVYGIRASMYDRMHASNLSTDWLLGPSAQADDTYFRGNQQRHQGLNRNLIGAGVGTAAWGNLYLLINDANILISGIEEGVLSEAEASKLRAEALFMRALAMHHGVRIFGYDPDGQGGVVSPASGPGAGFDLGIAIRTTPTLSEAEAVSKARSTVGEVYDQIESDLDQALGIFTSLPENVQEGSAFFASEASVEALMARVSLYRRGWADAHQHAQNALDLAASMFGSDLAAPDQLSDIFDENGSNPEAIFTIDTNPTTESAGVNSSLAAYTSMQYLAQLPTQDLISLYPDGDARLDAWYAPCFNDIDGRTPDGCTQINDQGFELRKYVAEQGVSTFADDYIHFRVAEMVLIQAEALLHTDGPAAAVDRLNDLRIQRGIGELSTGLGFDDAYDAILDERRRELVAEGHRFFDLKRLGRDIRKAPGTGQEDLPFNDYRILDDLPEGQLEVDFELIQNPGYND